ncbi:MAG: AmmeMemoRadiSam system protein B [Betaproteobacteria bacterium]|nr:AmmeMemoRadiSam system protein B [Betaproteobacteria bacterium]
MEALRPAAMAGTFYPGNTATLRGALAALLGEVQPCADARRPKAIIAPHAGYAYSGSVAARAYARLNAAAPAVTRVVLVGPAHRTPLRGLALPGARAFATPLGLVDVDGEAVAHAMRMGIPHDIGAHAFEHSLEVQLPFLQHALRGFTLVPLLVGLAGADEVAEILDALWGGPETLIVVSSDLSHFLPHDSAQKTDLQTAQAILALEGKLTPHQACGAYAVNGFLRIARRRALAPNLLDLHNSGETGGDPARVVGYGSFAFFEEQGNA